MQKLADISLFESIGSATTPCSALVFNDQSNGNKRPRHVATPDKDFQKWLARYRTKNDLVDGRRVEKEIRKTMGTDDDFRGMNVMQAANALANLLTQSSLTLADQTRAASQSLDKMEKVVKRIESFWDKVRHNNRYLHGPFVDAAGFALSRAWKEVFDAEHLGDAPEKLAQINGTLTGWRESNKSHWDEEKKRTSKFLGMRLRGKDAMHWDQDYFGFDANPSGDRNSTGDIAALMEMLDKAATPSEEPTPTMEDYSEPDEDTNQSYADLVSGGDGSDDSSEIIDVTPIQKSDKKKIELPSADVLGKSAKAMRVERSDGAKPMEFRDASGNVLVEMPWNVFRANKKEIEDLLPKNCKRLYPGGRDYVPNSDRDASSGSGDNSDDSANTKGDSASSSFKGSTIPPEIEKVMNADRLRLAPDGKTVLILDKDGSQVGWGTPEMIRIFQKQGILPVLPIEGQTLIGNRRRLFR